LVTKLVGSDIGKTFKTSGSLSSASAVSKTYIIIVLYGSLWMVAGASIAFFAFRPFEHHTKVSTEQGISEAEVNLPQRLERYINAFIPTACRPEIHWLRSIWMEICRHHVHVHLLMNWSHHPSPMVAVLELITTQSLLLCLLALVYDFTYPDDDGSCQAFVEVNQCLSRRYALDKAMSYCSWSETTETCFFAQPEFNMTVTMYVTGLLSLGTSFAIEPLEFLTRMLAAPTRNRDELKETGNGAINATHGRRLIGSQQKPLAIVPWDVLHTIKTRSSSIETRLSPRKTRSSVRFLGAELARAHSELQGTGSVRLWVMQARKVNELRERAWQQRVRQLCGRYCVAGYRHAEDRYLPNSNSDGSQPLGETHRDRIRDWDRPQRRRERRERERGR